MFKTPPYFNIATEQPAHVMLELRRKSDKETSDPVQFTYYPQIFGNYCCYTIKNLMMMIKVMVMMTIFWL